MMEARKSVLLMCCAFYHEEFKSKVEINLLFTNNLKLEITSLSNYDNPHFRVSLGQSEVGSSLLVKGKAPPEHNVILSEHMKKEPCLTLDTDMGLDSMCQACRWL
jgi:hypothetical protein